MSSILVARQDLHLYQGDDYGAVVSILNDDGSEPDLSAYTPLAHMRRGVADQCPIVDLVIQTAIEPPNKVQLIVTHTESVALSGAYVWDLQLIGPTGSIATVLHGAVYVTQEVTRA